VPEDRIAPGDQPLKEAFEVVPHGGIGILLDQQGGGGVADVQGEKAVLDAARRDPRGDFGGDLVQPRPAGFEPEFLGKLADVDLRFVSVVDRAVTFYLKPCQQRPSRGRV
jgi:hypothetical protein